MSMFSTTGRATLAGAIMPFPERHAFQTDDQRLTPIAEKVLNGERLSFEDGVTLY